MAVIFHKQVGIYSDICTYIVARRQYTYTSHIRKSFSQALTRALVGSVYNATWWGVFFAPPRISETTGQLRKMKTAFEIPVKFVEGN